MNRKLLQLGIGGLIVAAIAVLAVLFIRLIPFDTSDIQIQIEAPRELDIGSEADVFVTVMNNTRATLREGSIQIDLPRGIELVSSRDRDFEALEPRAQATAHFTVRAAGEPNSFVDIIARSDFRPRSLSATFTKQTSTSVFLRDLPYNIDFSFPSNISAGSPMTFYIRISSDAEAPIGPTGVELDVPLEFRIERLRPEPTDEEENRWDFGDVERGFDEEIQVTGTFDLDAEAGEFIARIGKLDTARLGLESFRQVREHVSLKTGEVMVDLEFEEVINPEEATIEIGEDLDVAVRFRNTTDEPINDVAVEIAAAHDAIDARDVEASEPFIRSVTGAYVFAAPHLAKLNQLQPKEAGEIVITLPLKPILEMEAFSDANQAILFRAQVSSGGRILGERQLRLKFAGQLSVDAEVLYYNAPGGSNTGPTSPQVGQTTTYTVVLTVEGGTNGLEGTTARMVLGEAVTYIGPVDPLDSHRNDITYNQAAREVVWDIGELPPGIGILSDALVYVFRIGFSPTPNMIGSNPILVETTTVAGRDTFVDRILDDSDEPHDTTLRDDHEVHRINSKVQVEPAGGGGGGPGDGPGELGE